MINSRGSLKSVEPVFGKAGPSAAFTLAVSRGECWMRIFDFRGILGGVSRKYNGRIQSIIIMGKCCSGSDNTAVLGPFSGRVKI